MKNTIKKIIKEVTEERFKKLVHFLLNKKLLSSDVEQVEDSSKNVRFKYTPNNMIIAAFNINRLEFIVEYEPVWGFIEETLQLPYEEVKKHITSWVDETFNYPNVNVKTTGSVEYKHQEKLRQIRIKREIEERRSNDEWSDYPIPFALMEYLQDNGNWDGPSNDEIDEMKSELSLSIDELANLDQNSQEYKDMEEQIDNLESRISEYEDVYNIIPVHYTTDYGYFEYGGMEFLVATDDAADELAYESVKSLIDDDGLGGFNSWLIESHIDGEKVVESFRDYFDEDVRENPEGYLDDDDRELTRVSERRISEIEDEISDLQDLLDGVDEDEINEKIEELESEKEYILGDYDSYEYSETAIDAAVENRLREIERDPLNTLKEFGMDVFDYVDIDDLVKEVVDSDGRGHILASYDGSEDSVDYDGDLYYIYRTN
jgi:hypothetical protein